MMSSLAGRMLACCMDFVGGQNPETYKMSFGRVILEVAVVTLCLVLWSVPWIVLGKFVLGKLRSRDDAGARSGPTDDMVFDESRRYWLPQQTPYGDQPPDDPKRPR